MVSVSDYGCYFKVGWSVDLRCQLDLYNKVLGNKAGDCVKDLDSQDRH